MNPSTTEVNPNEAQIGLYRDPESGNFVGCLDENQASAAIRVGFKLYEAGVDAAMRPESELDKLKNPPSHDTADEASTAATASKKGK
jgi:hypothetical protein